MAFLVYKTGELLYNRHLRDFDSRLEEYLRKHGLTLHSTKEPEREDWNTSPFEKPPKVKVSFGSIKVLGIPVSPSDTEYKVITAVDASNNELKVWMKVTTTFMARTRVEFKTE